MMMMMTKVGAREDGTVDQWSKDGGRQKRGERRGEGGIVREEGPALVRGEA